MNKSAPKKAPAPPEVAIVGMAFRMPGVGTDGLWEALAEGANLITTVEASRWAQETYFHPRKSEPGTAYTFASGSIGDVSGFDAGFFGISPREAAQMDPQQRILLELAWEAFENSGIPPSSVRGGRCAVFVGISSLDYGYRRADDLCSVDSTTMTGNTASIAANRLSYAFDLRGPSMAIDTACSSSLVAVHQACLSIRARECPMALVGGISLHLHPLGFIGFSKASMLSRRGVCNVFDAAGDGYVRSEGGAVLILKRLDQAVADGNRILAVIAGSGVNCDGKTNGLTVPSAEAQSSLLRDVYAGAGIDPEDVDYVEAHGTGTAVGDPIEAHALGDAIGMMRSRARPLPIGSVKSNLGHLEAAAGMAGMIKALLSIAHGSVPGTVQLRTPNPAIPFADLNLQVVTRNLPLDGRRPPIIGVNSFGFGGANAHVIVRGYAVPDAVPAVPRHGSPPLLLSARSPAALLAAARDMARHLRQRKDQAYYDLAFSAMVHRDAHTLRLAVRGEDRDAVADSLDRFAEGGTPAGLVTANFGRHAAGPVFVYSGNGSQWAGMGRELLEQDEAFRKAVENVDELFSGMADFSIVSELRLPEAESRLVLTEVAQPTLFAIQVGLTRMLRDRGVEAAAVVGHSVGEVAAAWACGALSLPQAVHVIHQRSAHQGLTKGQGQMTAVGAGQETVGALLEDLQLSPQLAIAGHNSSRGVTVSGDPAHLEMLEQAAAARSIRFKRLDLDYAFHSPAMDCIREGLQKSLADVRPGNCTIPFWSTVTGAPLAASQLGASYWWRNVREPVRFREAMDGLIRNGMSSFVEIGPHAVLRGYIGDCLADASADGLVLPTMLRSDANRDQIEATFLRLLASGVPVVTERVFPTRGRFVDLPNYPWQRERHWHPTTSESCGVVQRRKVHPLLGYRLVDDPIHWQNQIDTALHPGLADHVVGGAVVFPAAGFVEMALAAAADWRPERTWDIEGLEIHAPLLLDHDHSKTVRFAVDPADGRFTVRSRDRLSEDPWVVNVVGRFVERANLPSEGRQLAFPANPPTVGGDEHYRRAAGVGLVYGPAFRPVTRAWVERNAVVAELEALDHPPGDAGPGRLHPSQVDGAFQLLVDVLLPARPAGVVASAFVPVRIEKVQLFQPGRAARAARAKVLRVGSRSALADFDLHAEDGSLVAVLTKVRFRGVRLTREAIEQFQMARAQAILLPPVGGVGEASLPPDTELIETCHGLLHAPDRLAGRRRFLSEAEPLLDVLCSAFAERALRAIKGETAIVDPQRLITGGHVAPGRESLLLRLLGMLEEDGVVEQVGEQWLWRAEGTLPSPEDVWNSLVGDYPEHARLIGIVGHVGLSLEAVLAGRLKPADIVPREAGSGPACVPADQRGLGDIGRIMGATIRHAVSSQSPGRRLRVLALHTCAPTDGSGILPMLEAQSCEFVIGALSPAVAGEIELLLTHRPEVDIRVVEIEAAEGVPVLEWGGVFDIVLLPDGIASFTRIDQAVASLRQLLMKDGLLLMAERYPSRAYDISFGVHAEWWGESAGAGPLSRLRRPETWTDLLARHGFACADPVPDIPGANSGVYLILARAPGTALEANPPPLSPSSTWIVSQDMSGFGAELASRVGSLLAAAGHTVVRVVPGSDFGWESDQEARLDPTVPGQWAALREVLSRRTAGPVHWVDLQDMGGTGFQQARDRTLRLAAWLQGCASNGAGPEAWVVTRDANPALLPHAVRQPVNDTGGALADAALWGFARVAINEYPDTRIRCVDLVGGRVPAETAAELVAELLHPGPEDELILAGGQRYAVRIDIAAPAALPRAVAQSDQRIYLEFSVPGSLKNLTWNRSPRGVPGPGEVEVRVRAAGLNFRDVMYTMGLLPDEALESGFSGQTLGMELSGVVTRVGRGVVDLAVGDEVIAFAPSAFASHVLTKAQAVVRKPRDWSFEAAATVPTAFFTAYYALQELARLQEGERILIHGAAGGVGIAAIQLAKSIGAEVFATAGTEEKRSVVRLLGADHVLDSRSLAFADQIMELTGGEGVDAVLNSLAGEAINRNLQILKPFGRFLELGKRDFYENTRIGLRPMRNNIAYFGIDADQLMACRPALARRVFLELMSLFAKGDLKPLPHRSFSALDAVDAFRHMQHSRHIGKIVLSFPEGFDPPYEQPERPEPVPIDPRGTYLVTGGLSGFGLRTAQWLAQKGARHLVLLSRGGAATAEARSALAGFEQAGVAATAVPCDVTDRQALASVLRKIAAEKYPLRGVVHAAMVIDDGLVRNMKPAQIEQVLAPKVLGAAHLDELTRGLSLDFFVLYSSATTLFGNPGQANYVAANMYLEALADRRRAAGLPATCVGWGPIANAGYLARNEEVRDALLSRMGGSALTAEQALDVLDRILATRQSNVSVLDLDWMSLSRFLPSAGAPKFSDLGRRSRRDAVGAEDSQDVRKWLDSLPADKLAAALTEILRREIGEILRIPPERVEPQRSVYDLGMDSLMGVELVTAVESRIGVTLPLMALSEGPTIDRLVERIIHQLRPAGSADEAEPPHQTLSVQVQRIADQHAAELGEEEVSAFVADLASPEVQPTTLTPGGPAK